MAGDLTTVVYLAGVKPGKHAAGRFHPRPPAPGDNSEPPALMSRTRSTVPPGQLLSHTFSDPVLNRDNGL
ncbi:core protein [Salmonella bongori]|nr:core protein [Salmonella bongori]